jgi:hypothetical protein
MSNLDLIFFKGLQRVLVKRLQFEIKQHFHDKANRKRLRKEHAYRFAE